MRALTMHNPLAHSSPWLPFLLLLLWLVVVIGLLLRRPTPLRLALLTLLLSSGLALLAAQPTLPLLLATAATGAATALFALSILLPALLLCCLLEASGAFALWAQVLWALCQERDLLVLLLVLGLSPFAEALCGFGSGILLSLPLLLALDLTAEQAGLLALLGQSSTAFSGLANALTVQAALTGSQADPLGMVTAALLLPIHLLCATFALLLSGGRRALRRHAASALLASVVLAGSEGIGSGLLGVEVAGLLSSASVLLVLLIVARITAQVGHQRERRGRTSSRSAVHLIDTLLPAIVLCVGVLLSRLPGPLHAWLALRATWWIGNQVFPLAGPSGFLLLSATTAGTQLLVSNEQAALRAAVLRTWQRGLPASTALCAFLLSGALLSASGMSQRLSAALGHLGITAGWLAPLLALLGALLTNSNLGSASLFAHVQQEIAGALPLPGLLLQGMQSVGAILGRMLAPSYLLLASSDAHRVAVLWRRMALLVLPLLLALEETLTVVRALQTGRGNGTIVLWGMLLIAVTAVVTSTCAHWAARWSKRRGLWLAGPPQVPGSKSLPAQVR